jgi:hypothetical protein
MIATSADHSRAVLESFRSVGDTAWLPGGGQLIANGELTGTRGAWRVDAATGSAELIVRGPFVSIDVSDDGKHAVLLSLSDPEEIAIASLAQ